MTFRSPKAKPFNRLMLPSLITRAEAMESSRARWAMTTTRFRLMPPGLKAQPRAEGLKSTWILATAKIHSRMVVLSWEVRAWVEGVTSTSASSRLS